MKEKILFCFIIGFSSMYLNAQEKGVQEWKNSQTKDKRNNEILIIENVNYIDVINGTSKKGSILISNGKILSIRKKIKVPKNTTVIDGSGKWLMPGLIDSHIHLFQSGGLYTRPDILDLTKYRNYDTEREWLKKNTDDLLKRYLYAGITTVIDIGGPMYNFKIRDTFASSTKYPNIFLTGPLISTFQPKVFDIEDTPIAKVTSKEEAIQIVKDQLPFKPDLIKIWYIVFDKEDAEKKYDLIKATINESHKNGLKIAVHATQLHTAKLAIKAGADILVHSVDDVIDEEFISLLKANKIVYIPTLIVSRKYVEVFGQQLNFSQEDYTIANPIALGSLQDVNHLKDDKSIQHYKVYGKDILKNSLSHDEKIHRDNLKILNKHGITISTGTDAGNIGTLHASSYFEEIEHMKKAGMSNADILKSSTINGAKMLAKDAQFGSITVGKMADLILMNNNPLENLNALKDIMYVIKSGEVHRIDKIILNSPEELVQQQVNGYNARDIDAFLTPYSENIEVYTFPTTLTNKGKENIRQPYQDLFKKHPKLHCEIINRIVLNNTIIDYERISGIKDGSSFIAIAIYKIKNGKITKVYFIND